MGGLQGAIFSFRYINVNLYMGAWVVGVSSLEEMSTRVSMYECVCARICVSVCDRMYVWVARSVVQ